MEHFAYFQHSAILELNNCLGKAWQHNMMPHFQVCQGSLFTFVYIVYLTYNADTMLKLRDTEFVT